MVALNLNALRRDYGAMELCEEDMLDSPIEQCKAWLEAAIKTESHDPTAMVLSTVDEANHPDARVVLLKDLQADGFVFYTHYDSAKGHELQLHPHAALTLYWPVLSRQLRIKGQVSQVPAQISDAYFASRPYLSQLSASISAQSQPISSRAELETAIERLRQSHPEGTLTRPVNWGGYVLKPQVIEFWQGRDNRLHDRVVYSLKAGAWQRSRLAP